MWFQGQESGDLKLLLETHHSEFVPVVFVQSRTEADRYRSLLEAVNIPAIVEESGDGGLLALQVGGAIPLLVPEHLLDDASDIVAAIQASPDAEYDDDFDDDEDEDEDDYDDEDEDEEDDFD